MTNKNVFQEISTDLLEVIISKLSYSDVIRFSAVCTSWRAAVKNSCVISRRPVLLMIAKNRTDVIAVPEELCRLNLRLSRFAESNVSCNVACVAVSLREPYDDSYIVGSSRNILVLADRKTQTRITLIDRFSQEEFRLPPIFIERSAQRERKWAAVYIPKAVAFVTPEKSIALLAICYCSKPSLIYYGGKKWFMIDKEQSYLDVIARGKRVLVLLPLGSVDVWLIDYQKISRRPVKLCCFVPSENLPVPRTVVPHYLVNSMGELLLVRKLVSDAYAGSSSSQHTKAGPDYKVRFEVYKSGMHQGEKWETVDSLGEDTALFLGSNASMSVSSRDLPEGCEANAIYFTDYQSTREYAGLDMGVYSFKRRYAKAFYKFNGAEEIKDPEPDWLMKTPH